MGTPYQYKFFIKHSDESIDTLESRYGSMADLDWGWENSPTYGGGNRLFELNNQSDQQIVKEGYCDLPPGGVISEGKKFNSYLSR